MSELPVGGIIFWPSGTLSEPDKWSICDGRSQGADTSLGKLLGSRFGSSATGAPLLPDARGKFVRGARNTEAAGVSEDSAFQSHSHDGTLWQANHSLVTPSADEEKPKADDKTAQVVIKPTPTKALPGTDLIHQIHLEQLSLAPILDAGMANGAIVTFVAGEFRQQDAAGFAITSRAGNLFAQVQVTTTCARWLNARCKGPEGAQNLAVQESEA
jgi:hypothetical protein